VYLKDCREGLTKNTQEMVIDFDFVIRDDVDQGCKGQHIFKTFFRDEKGEWPEEKIGKYANSLGIEKGVDFDLPDLAGRHCVVNMRHYIGNDNATRSIIYFTRPSELAAYAPAGSGPGYQEVDEELPF